MNYDSYSVNFSTDSTHQYELQASSDASKISFKMSSITIKFGEMDQTSQSYKNENIPNYWKVLAYKKNITFSMRLHQGLSSLQMNDKWLMLVHVLKMPKTPILQSLGLVHPDKETDS